MSASAEIQFKDGEETFAIHQHSDGYPEGEHGVIAAIEKSIPYAWRDGRFEAAEFACAYIRANKVRRGGLYLLKEPTDAAVEVSALHLYVVTSNGESLTIEYFKEDFATEKYAKAGQATLALIEESPSPFTKPAGSW
ncbi:MAG: hypothetical protein LW865_02080 [Betaproteobacteria bacterium]|jgi:hypothetical protein|nr:hypothetical protein [Betaproteobacteria bacterium]